MHDPTQVPPPPEPRDAAPAGGPPPDDAGREAGASRLIQRGLLAWLAVILVGGLSAVAAGHPDGALLLAASGAFALAQATDAAAAIGRYRAFVQDSLAPDSFAGVLLRVVARSLVPIAGATFYVLLALGAWSLDEERPLRGAAIVCVAAAVVSLSLAWRPLADGCTRVLLGGAPTRTRRLTARLIVLALLLPGPGLEIFPRLVVSLQQRGATLVDAAGLVAQLAGELAIGFAGVGLLVHRDWAATRRRLGLTALQPWHLAVVAAGVLAAFGLNGVTESVERHFLPALWRQDTEVTHAISAHLPLWTTLLLGVAAGFGEEIPLRGALQPRAGVLLTSIVFACGHVQYSWYGMLTVALLGVLMGVIRARTNTSTAIVVHAIYDIVAVLTGG